jgi:hypothetical protein
VRILQVSYSAARVSRDAVGGAEQVLAAVDAGLAARGVEAAVVAPEGSRTAGALFPSAWIDGPLRPAQRRAVVEAHAAALRRALAARRFNVLHLTASTSAGCCRTTTRPPS